MRVDQLALSAQLAFRRLQIGFGLAEVGRGGADVRRFERGEWRALADALPDLRLDAHHTAAHGREDVSDMGIVERDPAWCAEVRVDRLLLDCRDSDLRRL